MADERISVEQVLPGVTLHPLPDGWTPVEAFVLIKCLDEDGDSTWVYRTSATPNREELLGALTVHTDLLRKELLGEWESEPDQRWVSAALTRSAHLVQASNCPRPLRYFTGKCSQ